MCYLKSSWQMFAYGGLMKLFGDLTALVGPISITHIVRYIEIANSTGQQQQQQQPKTVDDNQKLHHLYDMLDGSYGGGSLSIATKAQSNISIAAAAVAAATTNTLPYYPDWNDFIGNGWIMGVLVLIASLAQGSFSQASTHIVNMVGIRLRTSIQGLIYRKTLLISSSCFYGGCGGGGGGSANGGGSNNGSKAEVIDNIIEGPQTDDATTTGGAARAFDSGTITNLMSEDALNVMSFFWIAHYVWAIPLKV